jgi:hypothetical protein
MPANHHEESLPTDINGPKPIQQYPTLHSLLHSLHRVSGKRAQHANMSFGHSNKYFEIF